MAGAVSETSWSIARLAPAPEGVSISAAREVDQAEYERLGSALMELSRAAPRDVFGIVSRNMEAIDSLHATLVRRARDHAPRLELSEHYVPTAEFAGSILSALSNYLSAGRMYTDSMLDILSASYGKDSAVYAEFTSDLASLFDDNAGYRFTYHLRNALQHVGSLPLSITESVSACPDERVRIVVDRDRLLAAYRWHKKVRFDLLSGPEVVGLLPLLREGYAGYVWLERRRVRRCLEELRNQVVELNEIVHDLAEDGSSLVLMAARKLSDPTPGRQMTMSQKAFPNSRFLEAVIQGYETGDFDPVLPLGYERPQPGSRGDVVQGVRLGPALDLLDAQYSGGPAAAGQEIARNIGRGPQASANLIFSLLNLSMITLSQVGMAIGQSVESQLCSWRGGPADSDASEGDD